MPLNQDKKKILVYRKNENSLNKQVSILKTLTYFDQFHYPLTREELVVFLDQKVSSVELTDALHQLKKSGLLYQAGQFYSLRDEASLFENRVKGNLKAIPLLVRAENISRLLNSFPFVSAVFVSGSLSKNFAGDDADIDFFIITQSDRLWIARTLMHLMKKMSFIFGMQHLFCMNYFIDVENLAIKERNLYTATEIFTLIPFCGNIAISDFFRANNWVNKYYPNYELKNILPRIETKNFYLKKLIEFSFNNRIGNLIDNYLMWLTTVRWKNKENNNPLGKNGRKMGIRTGRHFCKPNPEYYQKKMLGRYSGKLRELLGKFTRINTEQQSSFLN